MIGPGGLWISMGLLLEHSPFLRQSQSEVNSLGISFQLFDVVGEGRADDVFVRGSP